jgi:hypothetical protein
MVCKNGNGENDRDPNWACGVVISYVGDDGKDLSGAEFKHGNIVAKDIKVFGMNH